MSGRVGANRRNPTCGSRKIGTKFCSWNIQTATAEQIAFIGELQILWIFCEQAVQGKAHPDIERKHFEKRSVGIGSLIAGQRQDTIVDGKECDFAIRYRMISSISHIQVDINWLSRFECWLCRSDRNAEFCGRINYGEVRNSVSEFRNLDFSGACGGTTNENNRDIHIWSVRREHGDLDRWGVTI